MRSGSYSPPALSEGLNNWLLSALNGGVVEDASLTLRGVKPTDTESRGAPGVKLVFNARDVDVNYAPGWPVAGAFDGQVLFDEGKFAIDGDVAASEKWQRALLPRFQT